MDDTTLVQTAEGSPTEIRNKWGDVRTVKIGRQWNVVNADGKIIGQIKYGMITRERRSKGLRYVNARWQSPGWQYNTAGGAGYWLEPIPGTKKECVERIVRDWARR